MPGVVPNEGEALIADIIMKRVLTDRDADLEIGLFENASPSETTVLTAITEPAGTGYARQTLTDASWTGAADARSYAEITFTAGAGGWANPIYGYFIATKSAGGTKRLVLYEIDTNGPYTLNAGDTYKVTPTVTVV